MALKQKSKRTLCGALAFFCWWTLLICFTGKSVFLAEFFTYESLYICIILGGFHLHDITNAILCFVHGRSAS